MAPNSNEVAVEPAPIAVGGPSEKNVASEKDYWNNFYGAFKVSHPSQFCVMTAVECDRECPVVEFGCGNGRDSIYLATHGHTVYGCDLSQDAIDANNAKSESVPSIEFKVVDASSADDVKAMLDHARSASGAANVTVYSRFFLHSIDETQHEKFFAALSAAMVKGDKMYHEYRCSMDASLDKVHGKDHYRRYIDTPLMMEGMDKLDFKVTYENTGQGMAKYKSEDPYVSRVIAIKR